MTSASDQPCEFVNHYWFSFGLDDRYGDPYCDRFLYSTIGYCQIKLGCSEQGVFVDSANDKTLPIQVL